MTLATRSAASDFTNTRAPSTTTIESGIAPSHPASLSTRRPARDFSAANRITPPPIPRNQPPSRPRAQPALSVEQHNDHRFHNSNRTSRSPAQVDPNP